MSSHDGIRSSTPDVVGTGPDICGAGGGVKGAAGIIDGSVGAAVTGWRRLSVVIVGRGA
jgi:hypothetical protein